MHSGILDSGHYTAIIKDKNTGAWMDFNDRAVKYTSKGQLSNEGSYVCFLSKNLKLIIVPIQIGKNFWGGIDFHSLFGVIPSSFNYPLYACRHAVFFSFFSLALIII